jgi:hypothetical protein
MAQRVLQWGRSRLAGGPESQRPDRIRVRRARSLRVGSFLAALALVAAILPGAVAAEDFIGSIGGRVFDPLGVPAADIIVSACADTCTHDITGTDGAYSITGLATGNYRVGITDDSGTLPGGYATATGLTANAAAAAVIPVGAMPVTFDVHAVPGRHVSGTITAVGGGPLGDILVEACLNQTVPIDSGFLPCGVDITEIDGTFSLTVLPSTYVVVVFDFASTYASGYYAASGYVFSQRLSTPLVIGATDVTGLSLALPAAVSIAGTVADTAGVPIPDLYVGACQTNDTTACAWVATGTDGSYTVRGLPAGSYNVFFVDLDANHPTGFYGATGFTGDSGKAAVVTPGVTGATGIDVRLPAGQVISGIVTDAAGKPIRAYVSDCTATLCVPAARAAADGSYRINVASGNHSVHVADYTGANLSGYYSKAGLANGLHDSVLAVGSSDLTGISVKLGRIGSGVHAGTAHGGKYVASAAVKKGTFATVRFTFGKTFAGTRVTILRATKSSSGSWSTYRSVATVVVAADGNAYYSAKVNGTLAFKAGVSDTLVPSVQVLSAPTYVRNK